MLADDYHEYLALWAAVLQLAICDARNPKPDSEQRVSIVWLNSNDMTPRSFLWVCDILGADPARVRGLYRVNNTFWL